MTLDLIGAYSAAKWDAPTWADPHEEGLLAVAAAAWAAGHRFTGYEPGAGENPFEKSFVADSEDKK